MKIFVSVGVNIRHSVKYELLEGDTWLKEQVKEIEETKPEEIEDDNDRFAFWLNAYNILVLQSVLVELRKDRSWEGNTSTWRRFKFFRSRKFRIGGRNYTLYSLENDILRKEFKDPRIHFALNCGSASCPFLPGRKFVGKNLDSLLDGLAKTFINGDQVRFDEEKNEALINKIFYWYKSDFEVDGGMLAFINNYRDQPLPEDVKFNFSEYDWRVNKSS